ncbi:MAG: lycopene cyclase [Sphingomonadales bacterium 32-68-7]|nr:MAG: lycopene cyclase [Sphingomonadales bacterium 12-68-11]OYX09701.1 MAG: lycopene cyclase [Sphingomonadales bacterium 32-68-7]
MTRQDCDIAIVGGGLAGGLIALALAERRPELDVRLIEPGAVGGNHVWSFFAGDVAADDYWLVEPLICHRWTSYEVRFPAHARVIDQAYHAVESEAFERVVTAKLGERVVRAAAVAVEPNGVVLADGRRIAAAATIDARGAGNLATLEGGWQKFVGLLLRTAVPHGLTRPIVMDATVEQIDGYRFVYVLPFGPSELFVEDTYYSDGPELDEAAVRARVLAYAAAQGWQATPGNRVEKGVLPVVAKGDFAAYWASTGEGAKAGMRAGEFHPTTGYSLPDAVRLACRIAATRDLSGPALARLTRDHAARAWAGRGFYRLLDTMLFGAALPQDRYRIMERFYRLPAPLIARFYAAQSTLIDKLRILTGKPPVPIPRAISAIVRARFG